MRTYRLDLPDHPNKMISCSSPLMACVRKLYVRGGDPDIRCKAFEAVGCRAADVRPLIKHCLVALGGEIAVVHIVQILQYCCQYQ